jgi:branched-chain amino acid transport system substrate-binding protein
VTTSSDTSRVVTVYSSLPLQTASPRRAQSIVNGEKLALHEAGGHVGRFRVAYISLDDANPATGSWDPGLTSANARTAAEDKTTIAYLGDWDSGATAVSLPIVNAASIAQISPASTYMGLTDPRFAGKGEPDRYYPAGRRNFVRLMPGDSVQAAAQLAYMRRAGARRLYVLRDRDVFDAALGEILSAQGADAGVGVVADEDITAGVSDPAGLIKRVADGQADAVLYAGAPSAAAARTLARVRAGVPGLKLFLPYFDDEPAFLAALGSGSAPRGVYVTDPALPLRLYGSPAQRFSSDYRAAFGATPDSYAVYGFEAMRLALAAIRGAGRHGNDRPTVTARLLAVRNQSSLLGTYSVTATGDTTLRRYAGYRARAGTLAFDRILRLTLSPARRAAPPRAPGGRSGSPATAPARARRAVPR